jgi:hypothetical protein
MDLTSDLQRPVSDVSIVCAPRLEQEERPELHQSKRPGWHHREMIEQPQPRRLAGFNAPAALKEILLESEISCAECIRR